MLVEDDSLIIRIYKGQLEESGFEVDSVSNGGRVLSRLREEEFDLVLLDLVLPEKTGFEVLRKIKEEGLEKVKVLVLSNLGQKKKIEKAMNLGAVDYLVKAHFTPTEVTAKVKEVLREGEDG